MKNSLRFISIGAVFSLLLWAACSSSKQQSPTVAFDFPAHYSDSIKTFYTALGTKGSALYPISCGKCHTTVVDGKEQLPDFTITQLENYELRFSNPKHETDLTEKILTQDELRSVIIFLEYRKRDAAPKK